MRILIVTGLALSLLVSGSGWAQEEEEPETRVVTVTTMHIPFSVLADYFEYVEKYNLPVDKENPHILGFKHLVHYWGSNDPNVWYIAEYKDLGEITKAE